MFIVCETNEAFEDQLNTNPNQEKTVYRVREVKGYSYKIKNDKGQERWYGAARFSPIVI